MNRDKTEQLKQVWWNEPFGTTFKDARKFMKLNFKNIGINYEILEHISTNIYYILSAEPAEWKYEDLEQSKIDNVEKLLKDVVIFHLFIIACVYGYPHTIKYITLSHHINSIDIKSIETGFQLCKKYEYRDTPRELKQMLETKRSGQLTKGIKLYEFGGGVGEKYAISH